MLRPDKLISTGSCAHMVLMKHHRIIPVLLCSFVLASCAADDPVAPPGPACAEGTQLGDSNECESVRSCGPGTRLDGDTCVPAIQCGEGTEVDGTGTCLVEVVGPACGPGTSEFEDTCTAEAPPTCGAATELIDGSCEPIERVCGQGTRAEGGACIPDPQCGAGAVQVGNECVTEFEANPSVLSSCGVVAREFCGSIAECCTMPANLEEAGISPDISQLPSPAACHAIMEWHCNQRFGPQLIAVAAGDATPRTNAIQVVRDFYDVDACSVPAHLESIFNRGVDIPLLIEEQDFGDACFEENTWCGEGFSCISSEATGPVCTARGTQGNPCDSRDDDDCQPATPEGLTMFCAGDSICKPYAILEADCTERRCDPLVAYCSEVCLALKEDGQTCASDSQCVPGTYCRRVADEIEPECAAFRTEGQSCAEHDECGEGLTCLGIDLEAEVPITEGSCEPRISICEIKGSVLL